jgi:hypothetical protein
MRTYYEGRDGIVHCWQLDQGHLSVLTVNISKKKKKKRMRRVSADPLPRKQVCILQFYVTNPGTDKCDNISRVVQHFLPPGQETPPGIMSENWWPIFIICNTTHSEMTNYIVHIQLNILLKCKNYYIDTYILNFLL